MVSSRARQDRVRLVARRERVREEEQARVLTERAKNRARRQKSRALFRGKVSRALEAAAAIPTPDVSTVVLDRAAATYAKEVAQKLQELTGHRGLQFQRKVLSHLLRDPLLLHVLPDYIVRCEKLLQCEIVCDGLAQAWKGVKSGSGRDKALARRVIEAAVISLDDVEDMRAAASCIGLNKRTIRRAVARRRSLNISTLGENWAMFKRNKRCDSLSPVVIDVVTTWWTEETRVSPCKKDVRKHKRGRVVLQEHACHWLEESQVRFLQKFLSFLVDMV
jgi:hypothetical protein